MSRDTRTVNKDYNVKETNNKQCKKRTELIRHVNAYSPEHHFTLVATILSNIIS